ncbi:MAG: stage III sporulation protein AB [Clostridiales bacterium]|nr:stage III sporulation protein AB [Clostridiales bacterium]
MLCKIMGSALIGVSSYAIGIWWSSTLKNRVEDIRGFEQALEELSNEIAFYSNVLGDAFLKIAASASDRVSSILKAMSLELKIHPSRKAWTIALDKNYKNTYLWDEDIKILLSLANLLGTSDVDGEVCNIKNIVGRLKNQERKAEDQRKKNELLFKNLSILIGMTIIIILL